MDQIVTVMMDSNLPTTSCEILLIEFQWQTLDNVLSAAFHLIAVRDQINYIYIYIYENISKIPGKL